MLALALRSVRHRTTAFAATFVTVALGTALMGSFATLVETAGGDVTAADAETLRIMGAVVGGWGALIVLFAVASALAITVRDRAAEIASLRTVGGSVRQVRRLVRMEALVVAVAGAALGAALASLGGRLLLALLRGGMVAGDVAFRGGPASLGLTAILVVVVGLLAAGITGRRATRGPVREVEIALADQRSGLPRWRWLLALLLIGHGVTMAVVTITVTRHDDDPFAAMSTSGTSGILVGLGLAVVAPALLRTIGMPARLVAGKTAAGHLAAHTIAHRPALLGGVLAPVIVLTAAATGVLMLVGIDGRTLADAGAPPEEADMINLLNNVVVGMIVVFAAVTVVNSLLAIVAQRRDELHRLTLFGATRAQVRASVLTEAGTIAVLGVVLGTVASAATVVPFAVAREEGVVPDGQLWLPVAVALGAVALTVLGAGWAVRRSTAAAVPR